MRLMTGGKSSERSFSAETIETLVWLAESTGIDRRRGRVVNRLRAARDSDDFATLPDELRERVRAVVADAER
jgi:hypothetical protein